MVNYNDHTLKDEQQENMIEIAIKEKREEQERLQETDVVEDEESALEGCVDSHALTAMQEVIEAHKK